jgi:hypothetical protein
MFCNVPNIFKIFSDQDQTHNIHSMHPHKSAFDKLRLLQRNNIVYVSFSEESMILFLDITADLP